MNISRFLGVLGIYFYGLNFDWILLGVWECGIQEIRTFDPYGIIVDRKKIKTKVYFLIYIIVHFITIMNYVKTIDYGQMRLSVCNHLDLLVYPRLVGAKSLVYFLYHRGMSPWYVINE